MVAQAEELSADEVMAVGLRYLLGPAIFSETTRSHRAGRSVRTRRAAGPERQSLFGRCSYGRHLSIVVTG